MESSSAIGPDCSISQVMVQGQEPGPTGPKIRERTEGVGPRVPKQPQHPPCTKAKGMWALTRWPPWGWSLQHLVQLRVPPRGTGVARCLQMFCNQRVDGEGHGGQRRAHGARTSRPTAMKHSGANLVGRSCWQTQCMRAWGMDLRFCPRCILCTEEARQ